MCIILQPDCVASGRFMHAGLYPQSSFKFQAITHVTLSLPIAAVTKVLTEGIDSPSCNFESNSAAILPDTYQHSIANCVALV